MTCHWFNGFITRDDSLTKNLNILVIQKGIGLDWIVNHMPPWDKGHTLLIVCHGAPRLSSPPSMLATTASHNFGKHLVFIVIGPCMLGIHVHHGRGVLLCMNLGLCGFFFTGLPCESLANHPHRLYLSIQAALSFLVIFSLVDMVVLDGKTWKEDFWTGSGVEVLSCVV